MGSCITQHICSTSWRSLTYMVLPCISPCTSPQSWSQHHDKEVLEVLFYLMGENCARDCFKPPERPKTWRLQRQSKVYQWVLLYFSIAVWVGFELSEGSTVGKAALSSWTYWGLLYLFFSFQVSKAEFFWGNPVLCRKWEKNRSPFLSLTTEAWETWSNALALVQILKTN